MHATLMATQWPLVQDDSPAQPSLREQLQRHWQDWQTTLRQQEEAREAADLLTLLDAVEARRRGRGHDLAAARRNLEAYGA